MQPAPGRLRRLTGETSRRMPGLWQRVRSDAQGQIPRMGRRFNRVTTGSSIRHRPAASSERLRAVRHDGQCLRDDRRLPLPELPRCSGGRLAEAHRRLQESHQSRRFLDFDSRRAALGGSRLRRHRDKRAWSILVSALRAVFDWSRPPTASHTPGASSPPRWAPRIFRRDTSPGTPRSRH